MVDRSPLLAIRREFRSYFLSPVAYIVIGVFLVVVGWVFFSPFFLNNRADLRDFFSILPLVLAFVVPAITMRLFSDEYHSGTYEITRTLPLSLFAVIAGKFAAALLFVALMLVPTISYPIFVSTLGNLDWGPVAGGYVGALLLGAAYCGIGLFASALSKNQIVAYVIGVALCAFFAMVNRSLAIFPGGLTRVVQFLSADHHFQNIAKGVFDTRDLVYFLSLSAIALYGTSVVVAPPHLRNRPSGIAGLQIAAHLVFIAFLVSLNLFSGTVHARADLTEDRIHSLSPYSRDTVGSLREPVTVRAFFSRNLPAPYNNVEQSLRDLLASYSLENPGQFNYAFYSMTKPEEALTSMGEQELSDNEQLAYEYGVLPIQIQEIDRDEMKLTNAYMGVVIVHGDAVQTFGAVTSTDQLELMMTTAIRELTERTTALLSLQQPISVDLYLSSHLYEVSPEFRLMPLLVEEIVQDLNPEFYNRLAFSVHDPSLEDSAAQSAAGLELFPLRFVRDDEQSDTGEDAFATVVLRSDQQVVRLNLINAGENGYQLVEPGTLRQAIQANLNSMLAPQLELGYIVGNGTPPYRGILSQRDSTIVTPDLVNFHSVVTRDYTIKGFFARNGVPEGLRAVMVVSPREQFTDYELFQLDQFLMRGGSLVVMLEAYDMAVSGDRASFRARRTGLEEMIAHYGVSLVPGYLLDEQSFVYRETNESGIAAEVPVYAAPRFTGEQFNQDFPFLRNIEDLVLVRVFPLEVDPRLPPGVRSYPLLRSSPRAWISAGDPNLSSPFAEEPPLASRQGQETVAYLLEGQFESYFAGRELPVAPRGENAGETDNADNGERQAGAELAAAAGFVPRSSGGRLLVLGTASAVDRNTIDPEGKSPGSLFLLNTIDFMNGREGIAEVRSKGSRIRPLADTTPVTRGFAKVFNIAGLPLIVILAGLGVWLLSRARRRRVQRLFAGTSHE